MKKIHFCTFVFVMFCAVILTAQNSDNLTNLIEDYCYTLHDRFKDESWTDFSMDYAGTFRIKEGDSLFTVKPVRNTQNTENAYGSGEATLSFFRSGETKPFQTMTIRDPLSFQDLSFACIDMNADGFEEIAFVDDVRAGGIWLGFLRYNSKKECFESFDLFGNVAGDNQRRILAIGNPLVSPAKKLLLCGEQFGWGHLAYTLYAIGKDFKLKELYTLQIDQDTINEIGEAAVCFKLYESSHLSAISFVPDNCSISEAERILHESSILSRMEKYY